MEAIPETIRPFVEPGQPKELRMMAAQGLVLATPKDLLLILYYLTLDADIEVSEEAGKSLRNMPKDVVSSVLSDQSTHPGLLNYFARVLSNEPRLQTIVLNGSAIDGNIAYLAETVYSQNLIETIANNHERLVRSEGIVEALGNNPAVMRPTLDGVIEYLKLYLGKKLGIKDLSIATAEPGPEGVFEEVDADSIPQSDTSFLDDVNLDESLIVEVKEDDASEAREFHSQNYLVKIGMLNIGEKIKLAILGNREARTILIRDPNRIVSKAVLRNPGLADSEIVLISQSKVVNEEILREIAESRKWARLYQVKLALVNKPKTPPHISIGLIGYLRGFDLRSLRWSKSLPGVITTAIKQVMQERRERK